MCPKVCSSCLKFNGWKYQEFKAPLTAIIIIHMAVEGNKLSPENPYRAPLQLPNWRILCRHVYVALLTFILQPITSCAKKWRQLLSNIGISLKCVPFFLNKAQNLEWIYLNSSFCIPAKSPERLSVPKRDCCFS